MDCLGEKALEDLTFWLSHDTVKRKATLSKTINEEMCVLIRNAVWPLEVVMDVKTAFSRSMPWTV